MGRIMGYLLQLSAAGEVPIKFEAIESRGSGKLIWSPVYLLWAILRIAVAARFRDLGIVHLNMAERASVWRKGFLLLSARAFGVPVLLHLHAAQIISFYDGLPRPAQALVRAAFRHAQLCVVLGEKWRNWLIGELKVDPDRVAVLRNGVPWKPRLREVGFDAVFRILFLGNLLQRKGIDDLLRALAHPSLEQLSWEAVVAGGGDVELYRSRAEILTISSRIRFVGWLEQEAAATELSRAGLLVLPSYDEGLPLVILEALGQGVPVIATPVGAIPEVLDDGRTALLVAPGDVPGIAEAIRRVITDPQLRQALSENGQALYRREFTIELFAERLIELYRTRCGV